MYLAANQQLLSSERSIDVSVSSIAPISDNRHKRSVAEIATINDTSESVSVRPGHQLIYTKHQFKADDMQGLRLRDFAFIVINKSLAFRKANERDYEHINFDVSGKTNAAVNSCSNLIRLGISLVHDVLHRRSDSTSLKAQLSQCLPAADNPSFSQIKAGHNSAAQELEVGLIETILEGARKGGSGNKAIASLSKSQPLFGIWLGRWQKLQSTK